MSHTTKIVDFLEIPNAGGQFVLHIICCGDHDHPHTVGPLVMADEAKFDASIAAAHKEAAMLHEARLKARAKLDIMKGAKVDHP